MKEKKITSKILVGAFLIVILTATVAEALVMNNRTYNETELLLVILVQRKQLNDMNNSKNFIVSTVNSNLAKCQENLNRTQLYLVVVSAMLIVILVIKLFRKKNVPDTRGENLG